MMPAASAHAIESPWKGLRRQPGRGARKATRRTVNVYFDQDLLDEIRGFACKKRISLSAAIRLLAEFGIAAREEG